MKRNQTAVIGTGDNGYTVQFPNENRMVHANTIEDIGTILAAELLTPEEVVSQREARYAEQSRMIETLPGSIIC